MKKRKQRVREHLDRLFAQKEREADHDWQNLTADSRDAVPHRTFFLGEVWFALRDAFRQGQAIETTGAYFPALVTRKQAEAEVPVEMAPSGSYGQELDHLSPEDQQNFAFRPRDPMERLRLDDERCFLLLYRRPVFRASLGNHLDTLSANDKQRLACL